MTYALAACHKQDRQIYLLVIYPCFLFGLRLLCSTNQCFCWMIIPLLLCRLLYYPRIWHGILRCLLLRFVSDVSHRSWKTVYSDILLFTTIVISDSCLSTCFSLFPVEGGTKVIIFSRNIKKKSCLFLSIHVHSPISDTKNDKLYGVCQGLRGGGNTRSWNCETPGRVSQCPKSTRKKTRKKKEEMHD